MQTILTAIYSRYNGDATLKAALPGGLFLDTAPQGTSYSYATYTMVDSVPDFYFSAVYIEGLRIQFDIYATTNALRMTAYDALRTLYDNATPAATGYSAITIQWASSQMVRDGAQNEIFRAVVDYHCLYQKT